MLLSISVSNLLSFKEEISFNLLTAKRANAFSDSPEKSERVRNICNDKYKVLTNVLIYGANASGKSNLIESINIIIDFLQGKLNCKNLESQKFLLGNDTDSSIKLEMTLAIDDNIFTYYAIIANSDVVSEELHIIRTREVLLYSRKRNKAGDYQLKIGNSLAKSNSNKNKAISMIGKQVKGEKSFFSFLNNNFALKFISDINNYLSSNIIIVTPSLSIKPTFLTNESLSKIVADYLKRVDTGVDSINTTKSEIEITELPKDLQEDLRKLDENSALETDSIVYEFSNGKYYKTNIEMIHINENGSKVAFKKQMESDGTRRLLDLIPLHAIAQAKGNTVIIIDEIDRSLHPNLTNDFINQFNQFNKNKFNQLIVTTHDTSLFNECDRRQDEIFLVEKDKNGSSHIASLDEFDIRNTKYGKNYLIGRFGGIPNITDN